MLPPKRQAPKYQEEAASTGYSVYQMPQAG